MGLFYDYAVEIGLFPLFPHPDMTTNLLSPMPLTSCIKNSGSIGWRI